MFNWILSFLRFASVAAAISAFLYFIVGVPIRWSITLAFALAFLDDRVHYLMVWLRSKPYAVRVSINAPLILRGIRFASENGVASSKEGESDSEDGGSDFVGKTDWESAVGQHLIAQGIPRSKLTAEDFMAADEFTFYELRPGLWAKEQKYGIGESPSSLKYSSSFAIRRSLDSIRLLKKPYSSSVNIPEHPEILFRQEHEWFKLTLRLPRGWNDAAAKQFPNAIIRDQIGEVIVELARIPTKYLKHMRRAWEISYTSRWKKQEARWVETLKDLDWEPSQDGTSVQHKLYYLSISVYEI